MAKRDEQIAARTKRFLQYIRDSWSEEEIADREGMEPYYAGKIRREVARQNGIILPNALPKNRTLQPVVGIDDESQRLRSRLGDMVYDLTVKNTIPELSYILGVPQKTIRRLHHRGYVHNWTLGQLQRLAKARNVTFAALLEELTTKEIKIGFAQQT